MRVSSNKDDIGFGQFTAAISNGKTVRAFLDGVEQKDCTMADDELGQVTRCVMGADGLCQIDPNQPDEIWVETVSGKVEIRIEDAA